MKFKNDHHQKVYESNIWPLLAGEVTLSKVVGETGINKSIMNLNKRFVDYGNGIDYENAFVRCRRPPL